MEVHASGVHKDRAMGEQGGHLKKKKPPVVFINFMPLFTWSQKKKKKLFFHIIAPKPYFIAPSLGVHVLCQESWTRK